MTRRGRRYRNLIICFWLGVVGGLFCAFAVAWQALLLLPVFLLLSVWMFLVGDRRAVGAWLSEAESVCEDSGMCRCRVSEILAGMAALPQASVMAMAAGLPPCDCCDPGA